MGSYNIPPQDCSAETVNRMYPPNHVHAQVNRQAELCDMRTQEKREKTLPIIADWKASGITQRAFSSSLGAHVAVLRY